MNINEKLQKQGYLSCLGKGILSIYNRGYTNYFLLDTK
jgi:hypothetical protein